MNKAKRAKGRTSRQKRIAKASHMQKAYSYVKKYESKKLSDSFYGFQTAYRIIRESDNRGDRNRKQSDVSDCVEVLNSFEAMDPNTFLTGLLEAGVVTFGFGAQGINLFERKTISVDR
ncbi:MAG: hypothetical protein IJH32_02985 [Ruminococcus sp.]|nr:hypothetical protein [Ruminococcus sp.]